MLQASNNVADASYLGTTGISSSGDFQSLIPGVGLKVNLLGFKDNQDVQRLWIYVRAGAGATFYFPKSLIDRFDVMIQGGPGIEYFTKLRHFAIGLEGQFMFMALTQTLGFAITPTLRYSF
jgi:hypothetical protein